MPTKDCPPGKILNPATNRCVKVDGKIGKALLKSAKPASKSVSKPASKSSKSSKPASKPPTPETPKKVRLLRDIAKRCNNDSDPISMDNFADMTEQQLGELVYVGKGTKKNCYLVDNIYEVYKTAIESKKKAKDPMDPSHELSVAEIGEINRMMKERDAAHKPPKYVTPRPYPKGWTLNIDTSTMYPNYFEIKIKNRNTIKFDLGLVPGWVETHHTGSADYTSGVLLSNLRELWDRKILMTQDRNGYRCCGVDDGLQMGHYFWYWQGSSWKQRFIELCNSVRDAITV
jgi:hypothetical protein